MKSMQFLFHSLVEVLEFEFSSLNRSLHNHSISTDNMVLADHPSKQFAETDILIRYTNKYR